MFLHKHEELNMKSILRLNQTELTVESVTPISEEFATKATALILKNPELYDVVMVPQEVFGKEDQTDSIVNGILHGNIEGEFPVSVQFFYKGSSEETSFVSLFLELPAFIGFRK